MRLLGSLDQYRDTDSKYGTEPNRQEDVMQQSTAQQQVFLQGDLQVVFDALHELGVIEPVLAMDWRSSLVEIEKGSSKLAAAMTVVNSCGRDRQRLTAELSSLDRRSLEYLAMEVAREYAGFHTRNENAQDLQ